MIVRNLILGLVLVLCSLTANSSLIKSNEIFHSVQYRNFVISPDGNIILGNAFTDGNHQLFAFNAGSSDGLEIFKLSNSGNKHIIDFAWIDSDTAYISYVGTLDKIYTRFIDFTFKNDTFEIDHFTVEAHGQVINTMYGQKDRLLFSKLDRGNRRYELIEIDLAQLRGLKKHSKRNHVKVFRTFKSLSYFLDNTTSFYVSDEDYSLEMIGQTYENYNSYSIYDKAKDEWREFYRSTDNSGSDSQSRLDIFKPVAKLNERYIIALSNLGRDKVSVVKYDTILKKDIEVLYSSENYDLKSATYNHKMNKLTAVSYVERGVTKQKFLDKVDQKLQQKLNNEIGLDSVFVINRSKDNTDLVIYANDASHPGKFYHYSVEKDKLRFLQNAMPDLHPYSFVKAQLLTVENELKRTVEGFLYLPDSTKNNPLVVMPHGGPIGVQDRNEFDRDIQFLINRGYAVLTVNFRGSSGYGKSYMNAGREQFGQGIEADIHLMTQKAFESPAIDSNKACIYGSSYGGYSAVTSTMLYPKTYKCAISAFGVFDLPLLYTSTNLNHSEKAKDAIGFVVGDIDTDYEQLKANSPLYKAEKIKVPILLFAGLEDEIATAEHSRRLDYVLNKLDKTEVTYHEYPRSGHGHSNWLGDIHQNLTLVNFLDKYISPKRNYDDSDKKVLAGDNYNLAMIYYSGYFVKKDNDRAIKYFRIAHDYGDERAAKYLRQLNVYEDVN
ncbi:prolyl oligopeptidase family serine peptidase [Kangiella sediminilitoris]|uniref:Peptidase S9 prolyl oligopeptidase catalytic domain-containing protein n=1 Tax=Kangiella sediminilitoris TaxID=1144748 RepID=A0A1B3BBP6_9GAMM|nr:prolyl oligopeptidase family serine peptidase [Kangiella sediminilitoris]AOE50214.1 hypothetical protein KS2013_1502 [Kangiella sediminilitoris]